MQALTVFTVAVTALVALGAGGYIAVMNARRKKQAQPKQGR